MRVHAPLVKAAVARDSRARRQITRFRGGRCEDFFLFWTRARARFEGAREEENVTQWPPGVTASGPPWARAQHALKIIIINDCFHSIGSRLEIDSGYFPAANLLLPLMGFNRKARARGSHEPPSHINVTFTSLLVPKISTLFRAD